MQPQSETDPEDLDHPSEMVDGGRHSMKVWLLLEHRTDASRRWWTGIEVRLPQNQGTMYFGVFADRIGKRLAAGGVNATAHPAPLARPGRWPPPTSAVARVRVGPANRVFVLHR